MRCARITCVVAVLSAACANRAPAEPPAGRDLIAMLRHDGTLVPFAIHVNGTWLPPPKPLWELGEAPAAWFASTDVDYSTWFAQLTIGSIATSIRSRSARKTDNHCQQNWSITTDFPAQPAEGPTHHLPAGVAMTSTFPTRHFRDDFRPGHDRGQDFALERFRERSQALPSPQRIVPEVIKIAERGVLSRSWIYIEASRVYGDLMQVEERQCPRSAFFKSWLGDGVHEETMELTDCDRKGSYSSRPLAVVTVAGRSFAVTVDHGYEDERYSIIQLEPSFKRVLSVEGGGC